MINAALLERMKAATTLTQAGRLAEATALIQRCLHPGRPSDRDAPDGAVDADVIDVPWTEVGERSDSAVDASGQSPGQRAGGPQQAEARKPAAGAAAAAFHRMRGAADLAPPLTQRARPHVPEAGRFIAGSFSNAAGARAYKLFVPSRYTGQALPLVVMLHGCKQTPDDFANGTRMNAVAQEHDCFVLYPSQSPAANASGCWNWFRAEDQVRDRGEPSILAGMTREVIARYNMDRSKVFAAGLSAGGAMAAVLAVAYPELFAAVGVHSGLACGAANSLPSALSAMRGMPQAVKAAAGTPVPSIVFHGDRDRTVHPSNGEHVVRAMRNTAAAPSATSERGQVERGRSYTRTVHRDAAGKPVLEYWVVHGGGHAWFGGSEHGSYCDPRGPDASAQMLRFFLQR